MPITSRKTESLVTQRPVATEPPQLTPPKLRSQEPKPTRAHPRQIKLPVVAVEGDPAFIHWRTFREAYAKLAEAAFSIHTVRDWRAAESILDEEFGPKFARDLSIGARAADKGRHRHRG